MMDGELATGERQIVSQRFLEEFLGVLPAKSYGPIEGYAQSLCHYPHL